jgi:hypothetical protein
VSCFIESLQVVEIPRVCQGIKIDNVATGVILERKLHKGRANKSGTTRNK